MAATTAAIGPGDAGHFAAEKTTLHNPILLHPEPTTAPPPSNHNDYSASPRNSSDSDDTSSSPYFSSLSDSNEEASPLHAHSPWIVSSGDKNHYLQNGLIGSLFREHGHIYSLAVSGDLLYTGSESKNIRVWKNLKEFCGFKSSSGFVKAIVIYGDRIFTGHQDGKIRVWKTEFQTRISEDHLERVGTLPTRKDLIVTSLNPKNYVRVRRKGRRNAPWIRHYDTVSCMSLDEEHGVLYSGSWDKMVKVWRVSDSKCLESIMAHDDAVNGRVQRACVDWICRRIGQGMEKGVITRIKFKARGGANVVEAGGGWRDGGGREWGGEGGLRRVVRRPGQLLGTRKRGVGAPRDVARPQDGGAVPGHDGELGVQRVRG